MVFLTKFNFVRVRGADPRVRKQMYKRMSWAFFGRKRHCYSISIRYVRKALLKSSRSRNSKKKTMKILWATRLRAACQEHGLQYSTFMKTLTESNIALNRKVLADLAIYEPRTFQGLTQYVKQRLTELGIADAASPPPKQILTRGMLGIRKPYV